VEPGGERPIGVLRQRLPRGVAPAVLGGVIAVLAVYVGHEVGRIAGRHEGARALARARSSTGGGIRVPLFVDPAAVRHGTRFNFTFDPVDVLAEYRRRENLDAIVATARTEFERAVALMHWASAQWELGRPDPYPPIDALTILRDIRAGRTAGFCAQYNYVFVQAVQSFGGRARYVTIRGHEVTEVWLSDLRKWICFDPTHDSYYTDAAGAPLSVHEISAAVKRGAPVALVGNPRAKDRDSDLGKFAWFAVWLKNDHVSAPINFADLRHYKLYFVEPGVERGHVPEESLETTALSDLYFDPLVP